MFTIDAHSIRARSWLTSAPRSLSLSDWSLAEFSSAIALGVRVGRLSQTDRHGAEALLGTWLGSNPAVDPVQADDIRVARSLIGATQLSLRAGDALHLAIAKRLGHDVATFDVGMARAAADLGLAVEPI